MIRPAVPGETDALVALGDATGIFGPGEADALLRDTLDAVHAGQLGAGHQVGVWADAADGPPRGWVYFAPRNTADEAWDVWWIGVAPARHREGIGDALLQFAEAHVTNAGGRVLFIETSSLPLLEGARCLYSKRGYAVDAVLNDFYGHGDDKVIFKKMLREAGPAVEANR